MDVWKFSNCYIKYQAIARLSSFREEASVSRLAQVTPWNRGLFEELTVHDLVKSHIFHGIRKYIAAFT
jgi:hypothetical protein